MTMKRKIRRPKIRPFKGVTILAVDDHSARVGELLDFIAGMGYLLYENPDSEDSVIISDKVLTFKWLRNHCARFGIDPAWWDQDTDLNARLKDELDEYCV